MSVRFDEALVHARGFLQEHPELGTRRLVVRDLRGRIRLFVDGLPGERKRRQLARALHGRLGAWSPGEDAVLVGLELLLDPEHAWASRDAFAIDERTRLLERTLITADWLRPPLPNEGPRPPRATLFGLKGGVGRSTALAVWARHLAETHRRRVLVVDLDVESPGVSGLLLSQERLPDWGLVDWFVEAGVGQGDALIPELYSRSRLSDGVDGEVLVVPASGGRTGAYIPKLARVYQGLQEGVSDEGFGGRLAKLLDDLEAHVKPDVVLLDSRAGLHDVAAVALTRLGAKGFLFAVDSGQTWAGYRMLFQHWTDHFPERRGALDDVRQGLQFVAAQVPETGRAEWLGRFREHAWRLFVETLYDDLPTDPRGDEFSYALDEADAPHQPLCVNWSRVFQDYDPVGKPEAVTSDQVQAAYGEFLRGGTHLLLGEA